MARPVRGIYRGDARSIDLEYLCEVLSVTARERGISKRVDHTILFYGTEKMRSPLKNIIDGCRVGDIDVDMPGCDDRPDRAITTMRSTPICEMPPASRKATEVAPVDGKPIEQWPEMRLDDHPEEILSIDVDAHEGDSHG